MYKSYFLVTTTKDDEMRIHLGANSRPISFEYYTENQNTQQTTSATYYYHYDLHGNVIRVTNSSGTTVISYTYDQLGTIVSETNANSIYNPFTYMGEAQIIHDDEFDTSGTTPKTGLYSSGSGYYNPKTGTFLGGSGAPASSNPTSTSAEEPTAQSTKPASQLGAHAGIAAVAGGVPSTKTVAASIDVEPEPTTTNAPVVEEAIAPVQCTASFVDLSWGNEARRLNESDEEYEERLKRSWENRTRWAAAMKEAEEKRRQKEDVRENPGGGSGSVERKLPTFEIIDEGSIDPGVRKINEDRGKENLIQPSRQLLADVAQMALEYQIANDKDPSDDASQYTWVIRNSQGEIIACQTKSKYAGDPQQVFLFDVDPTTGERLSSSPVNWWDQSAKVAAWNKICDLVQNGKINNISFYDTKGNKTWGCIGMQIDDAGGWRGIFTDKSGNISVGEGNINDFAMKDMPIDRNGNMARMITWVHEGTDASDPYAFAVYTTGGSYNGALRCNLYSFSPSLWAHNRYVISGNGGFWLVP
ncbi:MAG: hypothetical protein KA140_07385 [Caldisericia bacterium]|nr:hypothetical protein [Caldisericia bacterium]